MLTHDEKRELLLLAREAISLALDNKPPRQGAYVQGGLLQPRGAFVTIRIDHHLRGCIGYIEATGPLAFVVAEVAQKAAFDDPRFPPLSKSELEQATLEVSALSDFHQVQSTDEIVVGVHGLIIELGRQRGLLLPQVAIEQKWDRAMFLSGICRKAGLHPLAWQDPEAKLHIFTAEVFDESEILHGQEGPS